MSVITNHPVDIDGVAVPANLNRALADVCISQPACAAVLRQLSAQPTTFMSVDDIAAWLDLPCEHVRVALDLLVDLGFVRQMSVIRLAFYSLTDDPGRLEDLRVFEAWCDDRRRSCEQILTLIG